MKKIKFVLLFLFVMILVSCNVNSNKVKIGFLFDNYRASRWEKEQAFFIEKANQLGAEVLVSSANGDSDLQLNMAEKMISDGAKVIVVVPCNVNSAAAIVRKAHAKNIKVIAYDRLIKNSDLDLYLSYDSYKVGEYMAKYMINIKPKGNYVLINGDKLDNNAVAVYNGFMFGLKQNIEKGEISILYSGFMDGWSGIEAEFYTDKIIRLSEKRPDVILSAYDGLTDGIVSALKKYNLVKKVLLTGQDAEINACVRIMNGTQAMTIYKPGKELAYKCAEISIQMAKNENIEFKDSIYTGTKQTASLLLDPIIVDKSNIEKTIIKDGVFSLEEIKNINE